MEMLGKIRRMHVRDKMSVRAIAKRTGLSRDTLQKWLQAPEKVAVPKYIRAKTFGKLAAFTDELEQSLKADASRNKQDRRTGKALFIQLKASGYSGGYTRVTDFIRAWRANAGKDVKAFVPLKFDLGEAFQFDWSEEGLVVGGIYRRMQVSHMKLCASRAFWLVTNTDTPAAEVVQRYKSLSDIERGFRVLKSDIEIGPVYHRLPQRIRSHALVCFMALILYRVMRMRLTAAKRSESPATLLEQLKRIHQQTVQTTGRQNAHRVNGNYARAEITVCRFGIGTADTRRPRQACFVVCALDLVFNEINHLRSGSVELKLALGQWVSSGHAVLITGPTGAGKSWLACALAQHACRQGHSALYQRVPRLDEELRIRHANGTFTRWLDILKNTDVLLLDDWGMAAMDRQTRADLLEIIDDRACHRATIITSQRPIEHWHEWIGDQTTADAMLDRIMQSHHRFTLTGESLRKKAPALKVKADNPADND